MLSSTCPRMSLSTSSLPGLAEGSENDIWLIFLNDLLLDLDPSPQFSVLGSEGV